MPDELLVRSLVQKIEILAQQGKYDHALDHAKRILAADPDNRAGWFYLASSHLALGK